jgi:MFS family permease
MAGNSKDAGRSVISKISTIRLAISDGRRCAQSAAGAPARRRRPAMTDKAICDARERHVGWVLPLCWAAVALEGFDLVVLGVVLPALLKVPSWGLTPNTASTIASVGLLGVMIGAAAVGTITDLIGRRKTVIWTVILFSILTLACAFAPNPWVFGSLRFLAGLGLGGVLPTALALVNEFARTGRGGTATTNMMTGYHVGAVVTALLGILVIERFGWQWMFVVGALPALVLVPRRCAGGRYLGVGLRGRL